MTEKAKGFADGIRAEWKKIIWPSKAETARKTGAVVAASVALGAAIAIMDMGFQNLVNFAANAL